MAPVLGAHLHPRILVANTKGDRGRLFLRAARNCSWELVCCYPHLQLLHGGVHGAPLDDSPSSNAQAVHRIERTSNKRGARHHPPPNPRRSTRGCSYTAPRRQLYLVPAPRGAQLTPASAGVVAAPALAHSASGGSIEAIISGTSV